MNPEPTVTTSWDYLIELSDDGKQPDQPDPEVIVLPPPSGSATSSRAPTNAPQQDA
jgi:hypothetical protein